MTDKPRFAVSALYEGISREDFAVHLYSRQNHRNPFAEQRFTPAYYVLDEVYLVRPSPVFMSDLIGIVEIELIHKEKFTAAARELNPRDIPVPKIAFPDDLFASVAIPETAPLEGMKTTLRALVTDIVQEQRARLIYDYFAKETAGNVSALFSDIASQEIAHRRIFERWLRDIESAKQVFMVCPVCGKILPMEPKDGFESGCGYCMSKLVVKIDDDDFVLGLR